MCNVYVWCSECVRVLQVVSEGLLRLSARPALGAALGVLTRPAVIAFLLLLLW